MTDKKCPKCSGRKTVYFHEIANFNALAQGKRAVAGEMCIEYPCPVCKGTGRIVVGKNQFSKWAETFK